MSLITVIKHAVTHEGTKKKKGENKRKGGQCNHNVTVQHIFVLHVCLCVYSQLSLNYLSRRVAQSEHVLSRSRSAMPMHQRSTQRWPGSQLGRVCAFMCVLMCGGMQHCMYFAGSVQQWVTWWLFIYMSSVKCHCNTVF